MIERALQFAVRVSAVALGVGLVAWLLGVPQAALVLSAGLWLLIAVPIVRVTSSLVSWVKEGDWVFAALTLLVLACLVVPLVRFLVTYR